MAIQFRRGNYNDFKPEKMLEAEPAVVTDGDPNAEDGTSFYMSFGNGKVKRMATYEDMEENVSKAYEEHGKDVTKAIQIAEDWDTKYKPILNNAATELYVNKQIKEKATDILDDRDNWRHRFDDEYDTDFLVGESEGEDDQYFGVSLETDEVESQLSENIFKSVETFANVLKKIHDFMVDVKTCLKYLAEKTPRLGTGVITTNKSAMSSSAQVASVSDAYPITYKQYGKMVTFRFVDLKVGVSTSSWFDVASGFPIPDGIAQSAVSTHTACAKDGEQTIRALRYRINSSGVLQVCVGMAGANYSDTMTYICQ